MFFRRNRHSTPFANIALAYLYAVISALFPTSLSANSDPFGNFADYTAREREMMGIQDEQIKSSLKDCVDGEGKSAEACNESSSPFAQAAMAALSMLPMLMAMKKDEGQKVDCNKVDQAQQQAASQMGQGMPGCGGQPPGGGQPGGGDKGGDKGGNNMAADCGGKAGKGKEACSKAKQKIDSIKKKCEADLQKNPGDAKAKQCVQDADKGKKIAEGSEGANSKMGSFNVGQIMQMLAQMMCQAKKAQDCQKDVCAAPGQMKYQPGMQTSNKTGTGKTLVDDEGCLVDCNQVLSNPGVQDAQYPQWAAKVNQRLAKFKPLCECERTPGLPGCGKDQQQQQQAAETKKKDKNKKLVSDPDGTSNSSDKTVGADEPGSTVGAAGFGGAGSGGAGISGGGSKGADGKDKPRAGAPPAPPGVNNGYEGGGGSGGSRSSAGSSADQPLGKYSKYLPGRKPMSDAPAELQITGAGGKSIWEKVSDAYRIKASTLVR